MRINKKLRQKALRRTKVSKLFKKLYFIHAAIFIIAYVTAILNHSPLSVVVLLIDIFLALFTGVAQIIFEENIEDNKPLTKKQRKRTVFVLDVVNEKSYFEIQYLKPGTKVRALNYGYTLNYE